jgi:PTS system nitrogen regulatory IIA component
VETYLTIEELAIYLKVAEQTIRRWILKHEIPFCKIRKVIRFRLSEIERWIDEGGFSLPEERIEDIEDDLFKDSILFDDLAEKENEDEAIKDRENAETGDMV